MTLVRTAAALMAATFALGALAAGNTTNEDFRDSKKMLETPRSNALFSPRPLSILAMPPR